MAQGLFNLKQQLQGLIQKAWASAQVPTTTYAGSFNGSNQNLTVANNSAFLFGTGDFTVECFFNPASITSAASNQGLVGMWGTGSQTSWLLYYSSGTFIWYTSSNGSAQTATLTVTKAITIGTWYHVALVRYSGTTTIYINGTSAGSTSTVVSLFAASCPLSIAITPAGGTPDYVNGSLSNLRIVKGVAVYTSNFAVPTSPLTNLTSTSLLTLQNATIVDNSSNAFTITNVGSVTTSANTTIFVNPSIATPAVEYLVVAGGGGGNNGGGGAGGLLQGIVPITTRSAITVTVGAGGSSGNIGQNSVFGSITALGGGNGVGVSGGSGGGAGYSAGSTGGAGTVGQGNNGGTNTFTSNNTCGGGGGAGTVGLPPAGVSTGGNGGAGIASAISGTVTTYAGGGGGSGNTGTQGAGGVGGGGAGSDNVGTAGAVNTGGGGGGGWNAAGGGGSGICIISYPDIYNAPASFGGANSPTASTSGSGSLSFNGSNQALTTNDTANLGSGNFTVEFWVYFNSVSGGNIVSNYNGSGGGYYQVAYSSSYIYWYNWATSTYVLGTTPPTANTWIHYAIVKNGSTLTLYYNGAVDVSTSDTTNYNGTTNLIVGALNSSGSGPLNGYLSNLRIVKGTAIYTSTFTPPTAPLTAVTNTQILMNTVSGAPIVDSSGNGYTSTANSVAPTWNQLSPFATGKGYKNRVYTWTGSGTVTF